MQRFFDWFNGGGSEDPVLRAAIAHLWFVSIHPFDDGNGRIARAITDLQLTRSDRWPRRFYSMSSQILAEREGYYDILETTQRGSGDITAWLLWFISCLGRALASSEHILDDVFYRAAFWAKQCNTPLNDRQRKMLTRLLDGFDGKLTSSKWQKITKTSQDTALRDINDLIAKGILDSSKLAKGQPGGAWNR
jgi:Fic family protein